MGRKTKATDILDKCKMRINGLMKYEEFEKYVTDNVKIKSYLNISEKMNVLNEFMAYSAISGMSSLSPVELTLELEIRYLFNCLIFYTDLNIKPEQRSFDSYDVIMNSGLYDILIEKCGQDFIRLKNMIKDSFGLNDVLVVKNILNSFNTKQITEATEKITSILKDKDMIDSIVKISEYNDPVMKKIREKVVDIEIEKLKVSDK